jgi:hypothetical protein
MLNLSAMFPTEPLRDFIAAATPIESKRDHRVQLVAETLLQRGEAHLVPLASTKLPRTKSISICAARHLLIFFTRYNTNPFPLLFCAICSMVKNPTVVLWISMIGLFIRFYIQPTIYIHLCLTTIAAL